LTKQKLILYNWDDPPDEEADWKLFLYAIKL